MRILPDLPDLRILPTEALHPHELAEDSRAGPLAEALRREGLLRNPPIVLRLAGDPERYLVLDGANRTTAFRQLGLPHVLAQVVHPGDNQVSVETWNHVVLDLGEPDLLRALASVEGIALEDSDAESARRDLTQGAALATLSLRGGRVASLLGPFPDLRRRIAGLNRLVHAYQQRARFERTNARSLEEVEAAFPTAAGLVVFRSLDVEEIVDGVSAGVLLPAGLTRFVVSPRALRVNYPLAGLASGEDREAKQRALEAWLRERVAGRKVRYYAEATYLFDE